jgi:hypothetical protein
MDETYLGSTKFNASLHQSVMIKWIFGLYCRTSKIAVMYYLKEKTQPHCLNVMKKHIMPGSSVISDMHSIYCNLHKSESNLTRYGWYHMWTNHSETMVHKKYEFIHSMNIEFSWGSLKRNFK